MVKILHISDIHFGSLHRYDESITNGSNNNTIDPIQPFYDKIKKIKPDLIFICGDYVTGSDVKDKNQSKFDEMLDFLKNLKDQLDIEPNKILIVPGNHDIARGKEKPLEEFKEKFSEYLTPYTESKNHSKIKKSAPLYVYDDLEIVVYCLSTVQIAGQVDRIVEKLLDFLDGPKLKDKPDLEEIKKFLEEQKFPDIAAITNEQFKQFQKCNSKFNDSNKPNDPNKPNRKNFIKIILCHHPFIPVEDERMKKESITKYSPEFTSLASDHNYQITMYGHCHRFDFKVLSHFKDSRKMVFIGAPSLGGKNAPQNGFVLINIEKRSRLEVKPYIFSNFVFENDSNKNKILNIGDIPQMYIRYFEKNEDFQRIYNMEETANMIKNGDNIYVSGRSLFNWSREREFIKDMIKKDVKFNMVLLDPKSDLSLLEDQEIDDLKYDINSVLRTFYKLRKEFKGSFDFRLSDKLFLDSISAFTIKKKDEDSEEEKVLLFDVHTDKHKKKLIIEIKADHILYHYLKNRAVYIYNTSKKYLLEDDIRTKINNKLRESFFSLDILRQNSISSYYNFIPLIFDVILKKKPIIQPLCVQFEITDNCNAKCKICDRHKTIQTNEISINNIRKILKGLSDYNIKNIIFSGGEPTMHKNFLEILEYAKKECNFNIGVLSNGLLLNKKIAKSICNYADWIRISIDGSNKTIIDETRGSGTYKKLKNSLNNLRKHKNKKCKIGMGYVIQKDNVNDFDNMVKIICNHHNKTQKNLIDFSNFSHFSFKISHKKNDCDNKEFLCSSASIRKINRIIKEYIEGTEKDSESVETLKKSTNIVYLNWFINQLEPINIENGLPCASIYNSEKKKKYKCFTPYLFSLIDAKGDVYPCCHLYYDNASISDSTLFLKRKSVQCGNLLDSNFDFKKIWESDKYNNVRKKLEIINLKNGYNQCSTCTRFIFHNFFLTRLYIFYNKLCQTSKELFKNCIAGKKEHKPIWF